MAIAQIVAHNETPAPSFFGITSTWSELKGYRDENYGKLSLAVRNRIEDDMATMVYTMAHGMNAHYNYMGSGDTFVWPVKAKKYMKKKLGYSAKRRVGYKESLINSMINSGKPVFIGSLNKNPFKGGHGWVIDGTYEQKRTAQVVETGHPWGDSKYTISESRFYIHCNWGWENGKCNGYYLHKTFNLANGPIEVEDDERITDSGSSNYTWWFRIIEY